VQEVFALLVEKMPAFAYDRQRSFRAWLRTVTLNLWRGKQRKASASTRTAPLDKLPEVAVADPAEEFWEADYHQVLTRRALEIMRDEFHFANDRAHVAIDEFAAGCFGIERAVRAFAGAKRHMNVKIADGAGCATQHELNLAQRLRRSKQKSEQCPWPAAPLSIKTWLAGRFGLWDLSHC